MSDTIKAVGWGKCSVKELKDGGATFADIIEGSTSLSVEEGEEITATIEGGGVEAIRRKPDSYTLTFERRLGKGEAAKVVPGFTANTGDVSVIPESTDALVVTIKNTSRHIALSFDSTDGAKAIYTYKTSSAATTAEAIEIAEGTPASE